MTTPQTTTGTPADGYKIPPPIPRPRHGDDPTEPGRRRDTGQEKQR